MNKLASLLKKTFQKNESFHALIAFKGIKLAVLPNELKEKCIDYSFWENDKINDEVLYSKKAKLHLINELSSANVNTRIISYEALIYGFKLAKELGIEADIKIIDFNVFEFAPNNFTCEIQNIEDTSEQAEEIDDEFYTDIVASSLVINGETFVQYRDGELLKNAKSIIPLFEEAYWDYNSLETIKENDIDSNHFVFNFETREFVKIVYDTINQETKEVTIVVDNVVKTDLSAHEQLSIILDAFAKLDITVNLKRIVYDLTKSKRPELNDILQKYWGYPSFKTLKVYADPDISKETIEISQADVIESIVEEYENGNVHNKAFQDIFLTAPTGAGKSLLFQVPAIYIGEKYNALSIVVTPLKALMLDQVNQLKGKANYNKVAFINSDISIVERDEILKDVHNGQINILYLAPELLLSYDISYFLDKRRLGLYIVDEAHTVTTWGRDFRVDYWYLGYHINKVRKYAKDQNNKNLKFVVVAVTATAPYGKTHDVVFETLKSLQMPYCKKYIGYARRDDITFEINHLNIEGNLQLQKINLAVERIREFEANNKKTIVYCPYTSQVNQLTTKASETNVTVHPFHSQLDQGTRDRSYEQFRENESITMVATKAFGMGIDVDNITQVYHLAPTGLLTDYIQEIGRLARRQDLQGVATVDFSNRDFQFINVLHGLNRTFDWQLREVMRRLYRFYEENEKQNQLINAEDFAHIFSSEGDQLQNALKNALMLIEKDLNLKYKRIPVIIARPKNLFATVYASIKNEQIPLIEKELKSDSFRIINYQGLEQHNKSIIILELDKIWENNFRDKSFAIVKRDFFNKRLFEDIDLESKLRITITINDSKAKIQATLQEYFNKIEIAFTNQQGFFTPEQFMLNLVRLGIERQLAQTIADFILPMFSQRENLYNLTIRDVVDNANFLQSKKFENEIKYRVVDGAITSVISNIRRSVNSLFLTKREVIKYVSRDSAQKIHYSKVGQILEVLDLGTHTVSGGENPKIFVRINDPFRLRQVINSNYQNILLADVRQRHVSGIQLMEEFFSSNLTSEQRWDFIEDYFLGLKV